MIAKSTTRNRCALMFNAIAGCAAISLLITGCPGSVQPTPTPTASPTASPTPTGSPTPTPTASPSPSAEPRLFITNFVGDSVTSYANPSTVNGNIAPDTNLQGTQTQLTNPSDVVVNSDNDLIVSNFGTPSITSYNNAPATNGNLAPDGNVQGAATQLDRPTSLSVNAGQDLLFVSEQLNDEVLVFQGTAQASFNGNLAPVRTIQSADFNVPLGINFGTNDNLYVANNGNNNILVFAGASALNGNVNATRVITSAGIVNPQDVYVDPGDTMFVVNNGGTVSTFTNASTLNGNATAAFTLTIPGAVDLTAIAVDSDGIGYVVDRANNAIYSYDNIATLNGTINPDRTIQGANTQLNGPFRLFLTE